MDTPRLDACYFDTAADGAFARMARVLEATAAEHCSSWRRTVSAIPPPNFQARTGKAAHAHNTQKLDHWVDVVRTAPDGDRLLLIDADTMIVRPLDDIWAMEFDLAYTTKRHGFPFNLGVFFVRVSDPVRAFFAHWQVQNRALLEDPVSAMAWRRQHGGINQAAFGRLLEAGALHDLSVQTVPCAEWNCEESAWGKFNPNTTRILHVKGQLRRAIFSRQPIHRDLEPARNYWSARDQIVNPQVRKARRTA